MIDYSFEFITTKYTKGGVARRTLIYIQNDLRFKICSKDLNLYIGKKIESTFIQIIEPNVRNKNKIIGCIYKHPNPNVTVAEFTFTSDFIKVTVAEFTFTSDFINLLLEKLSHEKKR